MLGASEQIHTQVLAHMESIARYVDRMTVRDRANAVSASAYVKRHVAGIRQILESVSPQMAKAEFDSLDAKIQAYFALRENELVGLTDWRIHIDKRRRRAYKEVVARSSEILPELFDQYPLTQMPQFEAARSGLLFFLWLRNAISPATKLNQALT